jgi:hypothetical protein
VLADGARTTILSPEVIASALAGLEERVPSRRPKTGAIPAPGSVEETGRMSRPTPAASPIAEPDDDDELEAVDLGAIATEAMEDEALPGSAPPPAEDDMAAMQARASTFFGDDGMLSGAPEDDPMPESSYGATPESSYGATPESSYGATPESAFGAMEDSQDDRRSSVSEDELLPLDDEDEPPPALPAPPSAPVATERGPGGHEVLPFDRISGRR